MLELWFSTPVFYAFAPPLTKKAIEKEYFSKEKDILLTLKKECWGDNIDANYDVNSNLFQQFQLKQLEAYVANCACDFLEQANLGVDSLRLDNSWVNYSSKYHFQNQHSHMPAKISGVYYIKSNEQDGNLRIHSPIRHIPGGGSGISSKTVEYAPQAGKLIIFPSWVEHSVRPNMTDDVRISVSFNFF